MMTLPPLYPSSFIFSRNQYQHLLIATALALKSSVPLRARGAYDPDAYEADALRDHVTHTAVLREIIHHRSQREAEDDIRIAEGSSHSPGLGAAVVVFPLYSRRCCW